MATAIAWCLPADGVSADPLSGGVDPTLQNRIEQTSPGATDRLLNNLRENPPRYSAPAKKNLRARPYRHQHGNANAGKR